MDKKRCSKTEKRKERYNKNKELLKQKYIKNRDIIKRKYVEKLRSKGKMTKKESMNIQNKKIKSLMEKGLLQKEIAFQMGISLTTVKRRIRELRSL